MKKSKQIVRRRAAGDEESSCKSRSDLNELSPIQQRALQLLITGKTMTAAALAAGVHRATLHRWMQEDVRFAAAYHAWQAEIKESARARLIALMESAVSNVAAAIEAGDLKITMTLIKDLGLLTPITPGITDAEELSSERELTRQRRENMLKLSKQMAEMGM